VDEQKRRVNEKKFRQWEDLGDGGRRYWYDVQGRLGWRARYVKIVDGNEITLQFFQELYDGEGKLVETHEKYPEDKGHRKVDLE
jgi:hypothetical protein